MRSEMSTRSSHTLKCLLWPQGVIIISWWSENWQLGVDKWWSWWHTFHWWLLWSHLHLPWLQELPTNGILGRDIYQWNSQRTTFLSWMNLMAMSCNIFRSKYARYNTWIYIYIYITVDTCGSFQRKSKNPNFTTKSQIYSRVEKIW